MNPDQSRKIEELYLELFDKMMVYACCSLENEALAEEAVQETFRIACQKPDRLFDSANPQGWLIQTLKYTILNIKSNRTATSKMLERYLLMKSREVTFSEDKIRLNILYEDVVKTEEFLLLSEMAIEGRSHLEMASSRGISVSACKKRIQRAKETLRRKMDA